MDFTAHLSKSAEHALQRAAQMNRLAGRDAAENFDLTHCGEAEVFERGFTGAGLNEDAAKLGQRLKHQNAGHERSTGKMAVKKFLISFEFPHCLCGGTRNKFHKFVDEAKLRTMRQGGKRLN